MKVQTFVAAALALALAPAAVKADGVVNVTLLTGHSIILAEPQLSRLAVGDSRIAGVIAVGKSEIIINGKSPGRTTLFVWRGGRRLTYEVNVTEQSVEDVAASIRSAVTVPGVGVSALRHSVVVSGTVQSAAEVAAVDDVLSRFAASAKDEKYTLVNAVTLSRPLGGLQSELNSAAGTSNVRVDRDAKGNVIVSGRVADRMMAERVLDRARALGGQYLAADGKVVDRLGLDATSQISVKVSILEIDRTGLQQLGIRLQSGTPDVNHPGFFILGDPSFPGLENGRASQPGGALTVGSFIRTTILAPTLDLIQRTGHARLLSSPDLMTMPGKQATFLVGGEIPIPYASGPQQIAIQYKEFGVRLDVTPSILGNGDVETRVAPEVSDLDFQDGVQVSGFLIPALKTSKLATDVVTASGESIVLGGLLRRQEQRNIDKIPLLGDLPILGKLFRSTRYQNNETDVVFIMTPQIVTR